jgi:hypothetical protein
MVFLLVMVLAVGMFLLGRWGASRVGELSSDQLVPELRRKQERSMRRGTWVLRIVAVLLLAVSLVGLAHQLSYG